MWAGSPFFHPHSLHPLPLERCKVNISIGLHWPVSAALIPTLLFEGSIVPDLLAWFACLWIMAKKPQAGLLPSTHFTFLCVWNSKHTRNKVICPYRIDFLHSHDVYDVGWDVREPRPAGSGSNPVWHKTQMLPLMIIHVKITAPLLAYICVFNWEVLLPLLDLEPRSGSDFLVGPRRTQTW